MGCGASGGVSCGAGCGGVGEREVGRAGGWGVVLLGGGGFWG